MRPGVPWRTMLERQEEAWESVVSRPGWVDGVPGGSRSSSELPPPSAREGQSPAES